MILFGELAEHGGNVAVSVKTEDGICKRGRSKTGSV